MGSKTLGTNHEITLALRDASGIDSFIETGTWKGGTTTWAAQHFPNVITCEGMPGRFWKTWHNALKGMPNVMPLLGESADLLPKVLDMMRTPAIFWLEAHYCTSNKEERSQGLNVCPVMHEILAINMSPCAHLHILMVDDARLFGVEDGWPTVAELTEVLEMHGRIVILYEDVFYAVPEMYDKIITDRYTPPLKS